MGDQRTNEDKAYEVVDRIEKLKHFKEGELAVQGFQMIFLAIIADHLADGVAALRQIANHVAGTEETNGS